MDPWVGAVLLLALGVGLAILEIFFPSAGILGFLSACSVLGAIIMGFRQGPVAGIVILVVAIAGMPTMVILAFKWWPRTAIGRRVLLMVPDSEDVLPDDPKKRRLKGLIGQVGRAKSKMLPSGVIVVDGRTIDAVSEGMPIEAGQSVRVLKVRGNRVVVRILEEEPPSESDEDALRRPIESVAPDPFDEQPPA
jgi:membrane-bound ClpP family serine protease